MGFRIRETEVESKFSDELTLEAIGPALPMEEIAAVIREEGVQETRQRKLNMATVVLLVIAMNGLAELLPGLQWFPLMKATCFPAQPSNSCRG